MPSTRLDLPVLSGVVLTLLARTEGRTLTAVRPVVLPDAMVETPEGLDHHTTRQLIVMQGTLDTGLAVLLVGQTLEATFAVTVLFACRTRLDVSSFRPSSVPEVPVAARSPRTPYPTT